MKILLLLPLLFTTTSFAQDVEVMVFDKDIETKELEGQYRIRRPKRKNQLPDRKHRNQVFSVAQKVQSWDELSKDILYNDLKSKPLSELIQKYPDFTAEELSSLKDRVKE